MTAIDETPSNRQGGFKLFHVIVVSLSLMLTLFAWQVSKNQIENRIALRFAASRDNATALIIDRMTKYEDALWAGVAAVESHGEDISYEDWHTFARTLRIDKKYPGINGIGVIHFHTAQTLDAYLAEQRQRRPDFRVFPEHDETIYMPITFIEPENINAAAIGLDVAHEQNRRLAALSSAETGAAQITGPITLVQDEGATPGFLFYAPFYRGDVPTSVDARREKAIGAVYAPFVVHKLMEGLLAKNLRDVRFSIHDGAMKIYDEHGRDDPLNDPDPMFSEQVELDVFGRKWTVDIRSNESFRGNNSFGQSTFVLIAGLVIEILIISLLVLMARANKRAITYADDVTAALKQETRQLDRVNKELSIKNEELEQFAYVASHDLKTPIRGINGLTEMIEEDLEEYFDSPFANPEVKDNLMSIRSRVVRMSQLTQGIMNFAQMDASARLGGVLDLNEVVSALTFDLGLEPGQISLEGDVTSVEFDIVNLRRVLENLIGNAVKYHDGANQLSVALSATSIEGRCHFTVSDNGPGIDPQFHSRIFNVFQTLHVYDGPESTGIGLAIVKKGIERNGGKITLKSSLGQGAVFSFDWPIAPEADVNPNTNKVA